MKVKKCFLLLPLVFFAACSGLNTVSEQRKTGYNFSFTVRDVEINNPAFDRRSYYKVYINKAEAGRTTIGLESQKKTFEAKLPRNRHLLEVEKWVLNEKAGGYEKLNNIAQPKPSFYYFDIKKDNDIVRVTMEVAEDNTAVFTVSD